MTITITSADQQPDPNAKGNQISGSYRTPMSLNRHLKKICSGQFPTVYKNFSITPILKNWNNYLLRCGNLPTHRRYVIENYKKVVGRAKHIRVPTSEPGLIQVFERMYKITLPKVNPVTAADVINSDKETLGLYCSEKDINVSNDVAFAKSLEATLRESSLLDLRNQSFSMLTIEEAFNNLRSNTSSCYPLYIKKSDKEARDRATEFVKGVFSRKDSIDHLMYHFWDQIVTIFHRITLKVDPFRPKDPEVTFTRKIRQVFGLPFGPLVLETMFMSRVIDILQTRSKYFAFGLTRPEISRRIKMFSEKSKTKGFKFVVCGDLDSCDASLSPKLVLLFFSVLKSLLRIPRGLSNVYDSLALYLTYTPIMAYDSTVKFTVGGNKSGMKTTTVINCFVLGLAINYFALRRYGRYYEPFEIQILGDDFIVAIKDKRDFDELVNSFSELGLNLNERKTKIYSLDDQTLNFLGFQWILVNGLYVPEASDGWIIGHCCYPERFIDVPGELRTVARMCSIIFQIHRGKRIMDKIWRYDKGLRRLFEKEGIRVNIPVIIDDGTLTGESRTIQQYFNSGWTLF